MTIGSGACDHVVNRHEAPGKVRETVASRSGVTYYTASGEPIPNEGEVTVEGVTENGEELSMTMQVARVKKPLASVRKMCRAGNRVVSGPSSSSAGQPSYPHYPTPLS